MPHRVLLAVAVVALVSACAAPAGTPAGPAGVAQSAAPAAPATDEARRLNELVEAYFEVQLELRPLLATSIGDRRYNDRYPVSISPDYRARAERTLGERFDLRKFHTAVLVDGALPLDVLEAKLGRWIATQPGG